MAKGYSRDLRTRGVAMVEDGESRREAARLLNLAPATAIRWLDRWTTSGTVEAKPGTGHSRSPLKAYERWLLDLVKHEPDLTLEEIRVWRVNLGETAAAIRMDGRQPIASTGSSRFVPRASVF